MADNDVLLKDYAATPLAFNPRTIDRGSGVRENVNSVAKVDGTRINPATTEDIGTDGTSPPTIAGTGVRGWLRGIFEKLAGTLSVILPADQDPIFDHTNGVKVTTTAATSGTLITPPTGCKYIRVNAETDCFINTANIAAGDLATSIKVLANNPEVIPVVAGTIVNVYSAAAGIIRATPMKVR